MDRNKHIMNQAYALGLVGKHKGSKPIKRLKNAIGQFYSKRYWEEIAKEAKNK